METVFPCGSKGRPEFCPDLCQFGKFCKMKEQKVEPRGLTEDSENEGSKQDSEEDIPKIEFY